MGERENITEKYIKGTGIEIGALHLPLAIPIESTVRYVDRMSVEKLREQYPELSACALVNPDIICDGERLDKIGDSTQDFVIANHFLEHCQNPILAIINMLRVLKDNGILYLAIPDKRFTFDRDRFSTTFEHIAKDYYDGPEWSRRQHFEEWVVSVNKNNDSAKIREEIARLLRIGYSIHYHVWTSIEMMELFVRLKKDFKLPFEIELFSDIKERESPVQ